MFKCQNTIGFQRKWGAGQNNKQEDAQVKDVPLFSCVLFESNLLHLSQQA
jgi:hypothetical protein